jgi:carboxyl-terminal processing protease
MKASILSVLVVAYGLFCAFPAQTQTNRVLDLDGSAGSMVVARPAYLYSLSNALTLEVRFRAAAFASQNGAVNCLLRKNPAAGGENFFLRFRAINGHPVVEFLPGPKIGLVRAAFDFQPGTWYQLAATYDGARASVLVDGAVVATAALSGPIRIDDSDLLIGRGDPAFSAGEYFNGALDEVRVWNVARSPAQLKTAMHSPLTGKEPGLLAYWNFDDGTTADQSGHGNRAVLTQGAQIVPLSALRPVHVQAESLAREEAPLTIARRLEILEDLWQHLNDIYPALEYKGIIGHSWIEPAAERVREAKTNGEFYDLLLQLMATLRDTHTRIASYPGQRWLDAPPVLINRAEGRIAVIRAAPVTGLSPGDILLAVDGRPVENLFDHAIKRVCNSTDRGRVSAACGQILRGAPGGSVTVKVLSGDRATRTVTLSRQPAPDFWGQPGITFHALGSLGYIRIPQWGGPSLVADFDRALEQFKSSPGLIIDVRGNGGGDDHLADLVNGRLTDHPVISSIDLWRETGTNQYRKTIGWVQPRGPWTYRGRVAVLIDEGCASACEHFVSGIEAIRTILLVGEPTDGAGGGPTQVTLCDGTQVVISRALGLRASGVVFEGLGLPPHIYATPSLDDLRQGRDPALEQAKEWLLSDKPLPPRSQPL